MALQPCSPARYRELPLLIRQPPWLSWRGPPDIFCGREPAQPRVACRPSDDTPYRDEQGCFE